MSDNEHFGNKCHQMQETCNNCFGSKQRNTIVFQAKISKTSTTNKQQHTYPNIIARFKISVRNNSCEFLASDGIYFQIAH